MAEPKYWKQGRTDNGTGQEGIILETVGNNDARDVVSIHIEMYAGEGQNEVVFLEECDGYFHRRMTPAEAITALQEAIEWIREKTNDGVCAKEDQHQEDSA